MKVFGLHISLLLLSLLVVSCENEIDHRGRTPLVSVGKDFLYKEDVASLFVTALPTVDSTAFVHDYMCRWLEDVLFYHMAQRNVSTEGEIDRMVENYRRALLLNIYQERLIEQQLKPALSDEEVAEFYNKNVELFKLDEPYAQGIFLKLPLAAPRLASVRKWITNVTPENIESLEKYNITNAVAYDYFVDSWQHLPTIAAKMPLTIDELNRKLAKDLYVEVSDTAYRYLLSLSAVLRKGEAQPIELASDEIRSLLLNSKKANFVKKVKQDLRGKAVKDGKVIFHNTESSAAFIEAEKTEYND